MTGIEYRNKRIPYEDGLTLDEFNTHPALLATAIKFSKTIEGIVDFVAKRLAIQCG